VASSSTTTCTASLHTSAVLNASKKSSLRTKKINLANTAQRLKEAAAIRPSVVLGTRPHEEAQKWVNCDLAKVIIKEADLTSTTAMHPKEFSIGNVDLPKEFAFGVDAKEQTLLFDELPSVSAQMNANSLPSDSKSEEVVKLEENERLKANLLAKALDLRNANAAGIAFENRRRIIKAFSTPENPYDTGRTEVQGTLNYLFGAWTVLLIIRLFPFPSQSPY
jgi:small subunit ribosomal protein S15